MLHRAANMVANLEAAPETMRRNLEMTGGSIFSEAVLLALVHAGMPRQQGYVLVQRNAMKARAEGLNLRETMLQDSELMEKLGGEEALEQAFDLDHTLRHVDSIIRRVLES